MTYEIRLDDINRDQWEHYANSFADYSIYQTWAYQQVRAEMDRQDLSRALVRDEQGNVRTMCQVRIKEVKLVGLRIGYVQWGPTICPKEGDIKCSAKALELLRQAYVGTRVNVLRVVPNVYADETGDSVIDMFQSSGFEYVSSIAPYHTMMFPLDLGEQEMRYRLHKSWRRRLKKAEQAGLEVREGTDIEYLDIFERLYAAAQQRKGFTGLDMGVFRSTQHLLLPGQKMNVILICEKHKPLTADVTSYLGNTAVGVLQATSEQGLQFGASYLAWWEALLAARRTGMKRFDLGGINPRTNPSVYEFKSRMGAEEVSHIGVFEAYSNLRSKTIWRMADTIHRMLKR